MTEEEIKEIRKLAEKGYTQARIAKMLNKVPSTICVAMSQNDIKPAYPHQWTVIDKRDLEKYVLQGYTLEAIAEKLGKTRQQVASKMINAYGTAIVPKARKYIKVHGIQYGGQEDLK